VSRRVTTRVVDRPELESLLRARDGIVLEREVRPGLFEAVEGPVWAYERRVESEALEDGRFRVEESLELEPAVPLLGPFLDRPLRRSLARGDSRPPWWAPPERADRRATVALWALALASAVGGYLAGLLSNTITFAGREFGQGAGAQGVAGVVVRFGGALALVLTAAAADRLGRRRVILGTVALGCVLSASAAATPSLPWLTVSQALARPLAVALLICTSIQAAEEMPAGARAYAVSVIGLSAGLGGALAIGVLPLVDLAIWGWRLMYVLALAGLLLLPAIARDLPESRRFAAPHPQAALAGHGGRFWLLAVSAMLISLLAAPASFFANRYLTVERGFSAAGITLFAFVTGAPGILGVVVGGRLADLRGRRPVGAVAVAVSTVMTALLYLSSGPAMWAWGLIGTVIGAASLPALGVYGPELFPTSLRGRAGGLLALTGLVGSAVGLLLAGFLSDELGSLGPAMAALTVGPLAVSVLVLVAYPETARRSLEELNPEDRPPPR
jgi:MFS family permease